MKNSNSILLSLVIFTASLSVSSFVFAAGKTTPSKDEPVSAAATQKAAPEKGKSKRAAKTKQGTVPAAKKVAKPAPSAELKRAEGLLKEMPAAKKSKLKTLLNSGDSKALSQLPGIGETTAAAIIAARPLESAAHLILVKGVGEKTFGEIVKSLK